MASTICYTTHKYLPTANSSVIHLGIEYFENILLKQLPLPTGLDGGYVMSVSRIMLNIKDGLNKTYTNDSL